MKHHACDLADVYDCSDAFSDGDYVTITDSDSEVIGVYAVLPASTGDDRDGNEILQLTFVGGTDVLHDDDDDDDDDRAPEWPEDDEDDGD